MKTLIIAAVTCCSLLGTTGCQKTELQLPMAEQVHSKRPTGVNKLLRERDAIPQDLRTRVEKKQEVMDSLR